MATISASVGRGGKNVPIDVKLVQTLLNAHVAKLALAKLEDDGQVGKLTLAAIEAFQRKIVKMKQPDGRVDPGGRTFKALDGAALTARVTLPTGGRLSSSPLPDFDVDVFIERLDQHPDLAGSRVVYFDGKRLHVLREGPPYSSPGMKAVVIRDGIEETALQVPEKAQARDGKMLYELLGAGLACSGAVLGWIAVIGTAGAAPITGGTSTFLTYLALGAAGSGTVQCVNAVGRVAAEHYTPEALDVLDDQGWYQKTSLVLDGISLLGAATATAATIRLALQLRATTGKTMMQVLKGMSRQERKKIAEEAIRIQHPGISNTQLKVLVRAGVYPKRFTPLQISTTIRNHLLDAAGAATSFAGSGLAGVAHETGKLVIGIANSVETHR